MKKIIMTIIMFFAETILVFAHNEEGEFIGHHMMNSVWWGFGVFPFGMGIGWLILILLIIILILLFKK
jgi:hypothetical protein